MSHQVGRKVRLNEGQIRTSLVSTHSLSQCKGSFKWHLEQGRWNTDREGKGIGEISSHETRDDRYELMY